LNGCLIFTDVKETNSKHNSGHRFWQKTDIFFPSNKVHSKVLYFAKVILMTSVLSTNLLLAGFFFLFSLFSYMDLKFAVM